MSVFSFFAGSFLSVCFAGSYFSTFGGVSFFAGSFGVGSGVVIAGYSIGSSKSLIIPLIS